MELELGLKLTQTRNDLTSAAELRVTKDGGSLVFFSRETEAMFVLTAHLRGYRRTDIDIKINEDGTRMSISGTKPVQEKLIQGWVIQKKEVELRGFNKVFQIPRSVVLDKIRAKLNEEESILTVSMPKSVNGISGEAIEEVVEAPKVDQSREDIVPADQIVQQPQSDEQTLLEEKSGIETTLPGDARGGTENGDRRNGRRKKCKINVQVVAGSALLASLVVLVINLIRTKQR